MKTFRSRFLMVVGLTGTAGLFLNVNCGGGGGGSGTGGATSTGGKTGSGGATSTGGKTGTGGTAGSTTAGTGGTAGSTTSGTGGGAGAGGGHNGTGGGGGSSTTDGGTQQFAAFSYTFDTSAEGTEGFGLDTFNGSGGNVAGVDGGTPPSVTWDSSVGKPNNGSVKVEATFTNYSQFVLSTLNVRPLIDASGKTIQAWVMVDAVDGGNFSGYAQLQANTTLNYHGATGAAVNLTPGTWQPVTLNLATQASPFDGSQIIQISVKFATFSPPDSGTFGAPVHATFHFDSVTDGSGGAAPPPVNATFNTSAQGFGVAVYSAPDASAPPALNFDSSTGDPSPGSVVATLPFTASGQSYVIQSPVQPTADLTGKTLSAWIMLEKADGGAGEFMSGYAQLFAESGSSYTSSSGGGKSLTPGVWTQLSVTTAALHTSTTTFDPTQVVQLGIQIGIGSLPDGGTFGGEETPTFRVDSIVAQ
jgi:hypothetical protein